MRKAIFGVCTALALACGPGARAQTLEHASLATGGKELFNYLVIAVAERIDAFRKSGLDVEISDFPGGQKSMESLVGGSLDFAVGTYDNTIFLQAKGVDVVDVALLNYSAGLVIALNKQRAATYTGPKDLKGLTFGVSSPGSATQRTLNTLLAQGGLAPTDISVVGVGAGAGAVATLEAGQIDGFCHADPVVSKVLADGGFVPLIDTRNEAGMTQLYGGRIAGVGVLTTPAVIKARPELVQKMVNAIVRTEAWIKKASVDEMMAVIPPEFYGRDRALYRQALAAQKDAIAVDGITPPDAVQRTWDVTKTPTLMRHGQEIDLSATYDNRFAQAVPKE